MVALQVLSYRCIVTINVLWLFLTVPWVGLQCVIVVIPEHPHLLSDSQRDTNHGLSVPVKRRQFYERLPRTPSEARFLHFKLKKMIEYTCHISSHYKRYERVERPFSG